MALPKGTRVVITHKLGGNFTVMTDNGMFRIGRGDADALGEEYVAEAEEAAAEAESGDQMHEGPPDQERMWEVLKKVFDPEIPVNIVDLGLVYSLESKEQDDGKYKVDMAMTLTAPGCGMGPTIAEDAKSQLESVPGVEQAHVDIVWDPPWNQDMISEEGKMVLGLI
jgi:probable FeS assembly SUF system protein SufT